MSTSTPSSSERAPSGVAGLHHVALVSRDLGRSADFYGRILGLAEVGGGPVPTAAMDRPGELGEAKARWFGDPTGDPAASSPSSSGPARHRGGRA